MVLYCIVTLIDAGETTLWMPLAPMNTGTCSYCIVCVQPGVNCNLSRAGRAGDIRERGIRDRLTTAGDPEISSRHASDPGSLKGDGILLRGILYLSDGSATPLLL